MTIRFVDSGYGEALQLEFWAAQAHRGLSHPEERILALTLRPGDRDRILVVGCGAGREVRALSRLGHHVLGIDVSVPLLSRARQDTSSTPLEVVGGDARTIPFRELTFDRAILLGQVLGHLPSQAQRRQALSEAKRVLRQDGRILVSIYNGSFGDYSLAYLAWKLFVARRFRLRSPPGEVDKQLKPETKVTMAPTIARIRRIAFVMLRARALRIKMLFRRFRHGTGMRDVYAHTVDYVVRFAPRGDLVFHHIYTLREMLSDVKAAGLEVEALRSHKELEGQFLLPYAIRNTDFLLYWILRVPAAENRRGA